MIPMEVIHEAMMTRASIPTPVQTIHTNPIDGNGGIVTIFPEQAKPLDLSKASATHQAQNIGNHPRVAPMLVPQQAGNGVLIQNIGNNQVPPVAQMLVPQQAENGVLIRDTQRPEEDQQKLCGICGNLVSVDQFFKNGKHKKTLCKK